MLSALLPTGALAGADLLETADPLARDLRLFLLALPQCQGASGWGSPRWLDLSGRRNHGTLTNGPTWSGARGRPGGWGSLLVNGTDDYVPTQANTGITGAAARTMALWWNSVSIPAGDFVHYANFGTNSDGQSFGLLKHRDNSNVYFFGHGGSFDFDTTVTEPTGEWHHWAVTYDGTTVRVYRDGQQVASQAESLNTAASALYLGWRYDQLQAAANAYLDGVSLHARALSADEVWALYEDSRRGHPRLLRRLRRTVFAPVSGAQTATPGVATVTASGIAPAASGTATATATATAATVTVSGIAPGAAGSGTATATAEAASVTVSAVAPGASGTGTASAVADVASVTVSAVAPAASGTGTATATAAVATVTVSAVDASASTDVATATAGVATVSVSAVAPSASGTGTATAAPAAASVTTSAIAPTASATGAVSASPAVAGVSVSAVAPTATATGAVTVSLSAAAVTVTAASPAASGSGTATATAGVAVVTVTATTASATHPGAGVPWVYHHLLVSQLPGG